MTIFITPVNQTIVPGEFLPGTDIPLHFSIARYGSAVTEPAPSQATLTVFRLDDTGSRLPVTDRDGNTLTDFTVTGKSDGDDFTFQFIYKSKTDATDDLYFAEWVVDFLGETQPVLDRFRIASARTDLIGDVEFSGTRAV